MTLEHLLHSIANYGISRKIINYSAAGSSIADLNNKSVREYPILFTAPTGSHSVTRDTTQFTLTLYYIDRLEEDSSNDIAIYSTAIEQLKNIITGIGEIDGVIDVSEEYSIENFIDTETLSDRCAGAYSTIEIITLNDVICPDE